LEWLWKTFLPRLGVIKYSDNMYFSNHVDTTNGPPLPLDPNNVEMKKLFWDRVKCKALHKLQHCLGGGGKGEKLRQIMLIVLRVLSPIVD